jgi:hypothetical protein
MQKASCRPAPQLQVPPVARPRNHRYLQFEVAGLRRPRCVLGGREHGREIPPQFDLKAAPLAAGLSLDSTTAADDVRFQGACPIMTRMSATVSRPPSRAPVTAAIWTNSRLNVTPQP